MVVFTCNNCGDSLQKPRVEKHYQFGCRSFKNLTCVDCFKDFKGQEYESHTKCVSEDQRYSAKGSLPSVVVKKGEAKQESWTEMIQSLITETKDIDIGYRNLLNSIANNANVPRKKQKFMNYILNTNKRVNVSLIEGVWDLIEKYKEKHLKAAVPTQKDIKDNENTAKRKAEENIDIETSKRSKTVDNGTNSNDENLEPNEKQTKDCFQNGEIKKKRKKKSKKEINNEVNEVIVEEEKPKKKLKQIVVEDSNIVTENENSVEVQNGVCKKFKFDEKIFEILNSKKSTSMKKLQKRVLNAYIKHSGLTEHTEKHIKKFQKQLRKMEQIQIENDVITLKE